MFPTGDSGYTWVVDAVGGARLRRIVTVPSTQCLPGPAEADELTGSSCTRATQRVASGARGFGSRCGWRG